MRFKDGKPPRDQQLVPRAPLTKTNTFETR